MAWDPSIFAAVFIPVAAACGLLFAVFLWRVVARVQLVGGQNVVRSQNGREYLLVSSEPDEERTVRRRGACFPTREGSAEPSIYCMCKVQPDFSPQQHTMGLCGVGARQSSAHEGGDRSAATAAH